MDARQVARRADALALQLADHSLAVDSLGELHDVDEPGALVRRVVRERRLDTVDPGQELRVPRRDSVPALQDLVELVELRDPDRRADVVEAVVVAEPRVLQPSAVVGAALVPEALQQPPILLVVRGHDAALAGRDLLVRVEGEDGGRAVGADAGSPILRAERLTGVLDQGQPVPLAELAQRLELARVAEDVDRDDRAGPRRDRGFHRGRVEIERVRIDIGEDGRRALVDKAIR